ncbi:MAG: glycoside hydrolase family 95 protein [Verrucomicrobia bacterium]|nr:glycoside hydrolase family 95 protein [Verrucomicrobiota bacterium]MCH8529076.1 glycoside hydrolase family 95 protein [Kiritimatiellia bacterium]
MKCPIDSSVYEIWDDQPAPNRGKDYSKIQCRGHPADPDWEAHSYPIGNGYMGASIFGRTDVERIQITEKTLTNGAPYGTGGMTNFAEIFLRFDHYEVTDYKRSLNLNEGISRVIYEHGGVIHTREYFASYPNNVIAVKLSASEKEKLSFTVSAVVPYLRSADEYNHSGSTVTNVARLATIKAYDDLIIFSGTVPSFNLNYEGQIKVIHEGGRLVPNNANGSNEIRIIDADSVLILIATGTNYQLSDEIFLVDDPKLQLDPEVFPHEEVSKTIEDAGNLGYQSLKELHLADYQNLFSRVKLDLSPAVPRVPTKTLVENYRQDASGVEMLGDHDLLFLVQPMRLSITRIPRTQP